MNTLQQWKLFHSTDCYIPLIIAGQLKNTIFISIFVHGILCNGQSGSQNWEGWLENITSVQDGVKWCKSVKLSKNTSFWKLFFQTFWELKMKSKTIEMKKDLFTIKLALSNLFWWEIYVYYPYVTCTFLPVDVACQGSFTWPTKNGERTEIWLCNFIFELSGAWGFIRVQSQSNWTSRS